MKYREFRRWMLIVASALLLLWLLFAMFFFMRTLSKIEEQSTEKSLMSTASSNAEQVRFVFEQRMNTLKTIAVALQGYDSLHAPEALAYLDQVAALEGYEHLSVDYSDGRAFRSDGKQYDISQMPYLERMYSIQPFVLDLMQTPMDEAPAISIFVPIRTPYGEPGAALHGSFTPAQLSTLFDKTFFRAEGYYHLVDGNGAYVAAGNSPAAVLMDTSFFDAIAALHYKKDYSAAQILEVFEHRKPGFSKYSYEGEERYAYYLPVEINNWVLMMIAPKDNVEQTSNLHTRNSMLLSGQVLCVFLLTLLIVYVSQSRAKRTAILHEKCFRTLAEQTGKLIFDWDLTTNRITCLSNFKSIFGRNPFTDTGAEDALRQNVIHEDDRDVFRDVFTSIMQGKPVNNAIFRVLDEQGGFRWCSLSGLLVDDEKGRPFKAIGTLENIDEQVHREHDLRRKAETDSLTGLYNKATTEYMIREALAEPLPGGYMHALIIIDVDNFKNINDSFGHLYGDIVLSSLADGLKRIFRANDVIGRLGGDEFFVFLKNFCSVDLLYARAEEICQQFRHTYVENDLSVTISASVGLGIFPTHGTAFDLLYHHTDIALYTAKANGKDGFFLYDGQEKPDYFSSRTDLDPHGVVQKTFKENRVEYVFKLLYEAEDPVQSINATLSLISEHFDFLRSYIFELDPTGGFANNTFAWQSEEGLLPLPRTMSCSACSCLATGKDANDVCILTEECKGLTTADREYLRYHGLHAIIQFAICDQGRPVGVIRFDDRKPLRTLSHAELDEVATLCHVLATFLLKQRSREREMQQYEAIRATMDHIDTYVYVIDSENYQILYENQRVIDLTGESSLGQSCYMRYRDRKFPCEDCPMQARNRQEGKPNHLFSEKFGLYLRVSVSNIQWVEHREAVLICSVDIGRKQEDERYL